MRATASSVFSDRTTIITDNNNIINVYYLFYSKCINADNLVGSIKLWLDKSDHSKYLFSAFIMLSLCSAVKLDLKSYLHWPFHLDISV